MWQKNYKNFLAKYVLSLAKFYTLLITLNVATAQYCYAQKMQVIIDRPQILIGERVQLKIQINDIEVAKEYISVWPKINTTNGIEIITTKPIDTLLNNGFETYIQALEITGFDTGIHAISFNTPIVAKKSNNEIDSLHYTPVTINIAAANVTSMQNLHPEKDLILVEAPLNKMPILISCAVILLLVVIYFLKRNNNSKKSKSNIEPANALENFKTEINLLEQQDITDKLVREQWAENVITVYKNYLSITHNIQIKNATSRELLTAIKSKTNASNLQNITTLLMLLDSIKFANYQPNIKAATILLPLVQLYFPNNNIK